MKIQWDEPNYNETYNSIISPLDGNNMLFNNQDSLSGLLSAVAQETSAIK
ncbi:hypothetical protein YE105_P0032 (plasmid) [Yersinia enterocolitica subsp. palearctica 105.5R(r)]|uniref:Uncharacterized protein n=1 Tax=Yersinia enterocolitica subsp. palearctica serotype O:3 (strain DSM 13030 / CIP 106945 / Y11) TaxID=930944 RepID=A0A0H3NWB5_YERE1|nr:hypothetical protein YE105_P0032 [Yersinia enterocolitica subsp. palearctica 105.5R(r)]EOR64243.1 hypothetical protein YEP1_21484 [Yersinia enterocolitica subsp. palearctica YE-P1]EOR65661.1 hypothetical protein YE149_21481 [Yersinia enterocolitica subsp. palearctica YE-149]CBY78165.1 hypothetical protein Y11_p0681 [Yersinia enterocolitica subsp. palearctica Y11]